MKLNLLNMPGCLRKLLILLVGILLTGMVHAQFYNGHQMSFGKNRVQYREFLWQFYRLDKFDAYYYVNGKELAEFVAQVAQEEIPVIENYFQHPLEKRIIFLVYNKINDFKQSNISYISVEEDNNIGGLTQIINNKVFLYFEGDREKFRAQIKAAISEVILNEMLYGSSFTERLANSTLLTTPAWYQPGLVSFLSDEWSQDAENHIRDGVLSGKYSKINLLSGEDAKFAGHSIWAFIAKNYGKSTIPSIVYLTRIHKNSDQGFLYMLGTEFEELAAEWLFQLEKKYADDFNKREELNLQEKLFKPKKETSITAVKISGDEKHLAWVTNHGGRYKIYLKNLETGKVKRIFRKEHPLVQVTDYNLPVLAWHPGNQLLAFIANIQGNNYLYLYNLETERLERSQLFYYEQINDFSYSDDGLKLVLSATMKGYSDIYIHSLTAKTNQQITNDFADDFNPIFIESSNKILFSSNRADHQLIPEAGPDVPTNRNRDIFIYDLDTKSQELIRVTQTPDIDEFEPREIKKHYYSFLSDETGLYNLHYARFDSTIAFIDTITHYRYYSKTFPGTNFSRSINHFDLTKQNQCVFTFTQGLRDWMIQREMNESSYPSGPVSEFKKTKIRYFHQQDSLAAEQTDKLEQQIARAEEIRLSLINDTVIDINNYHFEIERFGSRANEQLALKQKSGTKPDLPRPRIYLTSFYTNTMVNQVDFSFLNFSYQSFTGGAVYYNPGFNFLFKAGVNDLFEDYRLTGAFRFSTDFQSHEYLLSFENLKNRLDEQFLFHEQTFKEIGTYTGTKTSSQELMYIRKYPFSQVSAIKGTASLRYDKIIQLSTDNTSAREPNIERFWSGIKFEYIFDNTKDLALNIKSGTRLKVFWENYFKLGDSFSDMYVLGLDIRNYVPIHRELIWASRFAASSNFGRSRLIYYLGSLDNWMSFVSGDEVFDSSIAIDKTQNFEYQTVATNMRGFPQNIRNGNNFFVLNNEIRFPFVKYFYRKPISNDFLSSLQVIGFFDVGTAWSGNSLYALNNAYNYVVVSNGPVTVVLNKDINPFVYGYGWGLRTRLFGYFIRADWAWGVEDQIIQPRMFYLSLSLDF